MAFSNDHLSYSRISKYEQCPQLFKFHYIDRLSSESGVDARFGRAIHWVLEYLVGEHVEAFKCAPLDEARALELLREAWAREQLSGVALYEEAIGILRRFIAEQGVVDWRSVLGVEQEFHLSIGRFSVLGYIDRADRVDDETIEVIDYKTSRMLFTREEVDTSLQMSIYAMAIRQAFPQVKKVRLTFVMLRHGVRLTTERTEAQLAAARAYIEAMGEASEKATSFPARLGPSCIHCDHRHRCGAYADALAGKRSVIAKDMNDVETVAREREEVARMAKIAYARKEELERVLKAHLKEHDELRLGGVRYAMFKAAHTQYPLDKTVEAVAAAAGMDRHEVLERIAVVDKNALEALLEDMNHTMPRNRLNVLKAELDARATKTYTPRFWAKNEVTR